MVCACDMPTDAFTPHRVSFCPRNLAQFLFKVSSRVSYSWPPDSHIAHSQRARVQLTHSYTHHAHITIVRTYSVLCVTPCRIHLSTGVCARHANDDGLACHRAAAAGAASVLHMWWRSGVLLNRLCNAQMRNVCGATITEQQQ